MSADAPNAVAKGFLMESDTDALIAAADARAVLQQRRTPFLR
jgi:hypothetical protein